MLEHHVSQRMPDPQGHRGVGRIKSNTPASSAIAGRTEEAGFVGQMLLDSPPLVLVHSSIFNSVPEPTKIAFLAMLSGIRDKGTEMSKFTAKNLAPPDHETDVSKIVAFIKGFLDPLQEDANDKEEALVLPPLGPCVAGLRLFWAFVGVGIIDFS